MLTEVISQLNEAVLEMALVDAFYDLGFYEGEEIINDLEKYMDDVENERNTVEQDDAFFEIATPYIENSIMAYSSTIQEGAGEGTAPASKQRAKEKIVTGGVGADVLSQSLNTNRADAKKSLTESEEAEIWEGVASKMMGSAKKGLGKAKDALALYGKALADATKVGLASGAKKFKHNLSGMKVPKGDTPNPPENK